ncbi:unnamed protein product [Brassica rapa subsp. trilocularis]
MASSLDCLTDSLPQLNTSFLQFQVRAIGSHENVEKSHELLDRLCESSNGCFTSKKISELMIADMLLLDKKIATAEKSKHVASTNPSKPAGNVKSVMENSAILIFKNPKKFVEKYFGQNIGSEGNDYPGDDSLGIGDVETNLSPVVDRNVSVNTKDCTADGGFETTETNAPNDPC